MKYRVLVVDDDVVFGTMLKGWLARNGYESALASSVRSAEEMLASFRPDMVLSDLMLPDGTGMDLLKVAAEHVPEVPFIMMTSYGEIQTAVEAMKLGARDYLEKPVNPQILREKISQLLDGSHEREAKAAAAHPSFSMDKVVLGSSPAAVRLYEYIRKVAPTLLSVLISGESGTGKEYAARMVHMYSNRSGKPFVPVDCGSLSKDLAASELFGHVKGAFTSAIDDKQGIFVEADGGTVFLDEVGNLSYDVQVQLLRALQEHKVRPVGGSKDIAVDVRIIAATNEDLKAAIAEGRFREDLFHRLNEFSLTLPALRECKADIRRFAGEFLKQADEELGREVKGFSEAALARLEKGRWSGNLRELRNVVRRAVLFAIGDEVEADDLPDFALAADVEEQDGIPAYEPGNERERIRAALKQANGNKSLAAQLLGIDRKTLYNRLHHYGMEI